MEFKDNKKDFFTLLTFQLRSSELVLSPFRVIPPSIGLFEHFALDSACLERQFGAIGVPNSSI